MKFRTSKTDGYITVYCSLTFMVLLSLILLLTEGARTNGARFMSEYAVDIGMDSVLAEYHRELFKKYDILSVDTSYGRGEPSLQKTAEHMSSYVDRNLAIRGVGSLFGSGDLFKLHTFEVTPLNASYLTDGFGEVFRRQAEEERMQMLGLRAASEFLGFDDKDISSMEEGKYDSMRESTEQGINAARNTKIKISEDEYEYVEVNNPADGVNSKRGTGVLVLALKDTSEISKAKIDLDSRLEKRAINLGVGVNYLKYGNETYKDKLLFRDYINTYFGCYGEEYEDSFLRYEKEYILIGKDSDLENLKGVANRLFAIKETSNIEYLFANAGKRAAIKTVATTVSAISALPWLEPLIEYSVLFGWAFAETVADMRCLYNGGKVPLVKTDATWKTDLDSALSNAFMDYEGDSGGEGLDYEDYLQGMLLLQDINEQSVRALDIIELTIRQTPGNASFRIDGCVDGVTLKTVITSNYGDDFSLTRDLYY